MVDEHKFEYKTIDVAKYWLEEGWYTVKQLEDLLEHNRRMNNHLRKSIEIVKEKEHDLL